MDISTYAQEYHKIKKITLQILHIVTKTDNRVLQQSVQFVDCDPNVASQSDFLSSSHYGVNQEKFPNFLFSWLIFNSVIMTC